MSTKKIIAVTMSTGTQGYSVVNTLLKDGTFTVRGLTRDLASTKAQGFFLGPSVRVFATN